MLAIDIYKSDGSKFGSLERPSVSLDMVEFADRMLPFLILLSVAEWLTRFELRPSGFAR